MGGGGCEDHCSPKPFAHDGIQPRPHQSSRVIADLHRRLLHVAFPEGGRPLPGAWTCPPRARNKRVDTYAAVGSRDIGAGDR